MPYVQIQDAYFDHPKVLRVGKDAKLLSVAAICYCGAQLTDGFIPRAAVPVLAAKTGVTRYQPAVAELVEAKLWEVADGGYLAHDYLDYNPSAQKVRANREAARERMQRLRSPDVRANIGGTSGAVTPQVRDLTTTTTRGSSEPNGSPEPQRRVPPRYSAEFERFFGRYPKGRGSKAEAFKLWQRLSDEDRAAAEAALPRFLDCRDWREGFHPSPEVWLRGRRWENPPEPAKSEADLVYEAFMNGAAAPPATAPNGGTR